jgi:hypothetical protein
MKIILALAVAVLINLSCRAESFITKKPVICTNIETIIERLTNKFEELPFWSGVGLENKFVLMVNNKTGTWTMLEFNNDTACIIGEGKEADQIFSKPSL